MESRGGTIRALWDVRIEVVVEEDVPWELPLADRGMEEGVE